MHVHISSSSLSAVNIQFRSFLKALEIKELTPLSPFLTRELVVLSTLAQLLSSFRFLGHSSRITFWGMEKQLPSRSFKYMAFL